MSQWTTVAEEVAAKLREDAAERDRANAAPEREVELLRSSGLLTAFIPAELGGGDADPATSDSVTRIIAAADASIGHLLGYHYLHVWRSELFGDQDRVTRLRRETSANQWFWGGVANPLDAALELTPAEDGFLVNGRKTFATGASLADRLVVSGTRTDTGEKLTFTMDARANGVRYLDDWDNVGQRLTESGGVLFTDAPVAADDVLGVHPPSEEDSPAALRLSLAQIAFQAVLSQLHVGIAEGALEQAAEYTRTMSRPWFLSGVDNASDDLYVLVGYGELVASTEAAGLLADHASALLYAAAAEPELTPELRAAAALTISSAKVVSTKAVNEVTAKIFEFVGARATASKYGFDRFWRNARTITLHDPVSYKARELGAHLLTGELPPITGYS
ncbi:acyl-CoA dehydrogenase family protein [Allokutzneria sp. A3M-2-11 16]|uniref:acyl-CoA dehydrogenase family protein n=1 Tax=Allokutzneria sp. A3M-2-11 16 TaxID=2962043 RepID=UPI0020B8DB98|nr:acyl-CoA dehydrogenase family protein [Allokutzneria sp. A3M-2-11 16]MCP3804672.1 acyl-CoA dehydrogenase family protein [Allokutzneria sp. A3M-2-11 16]